MAGLDDYDRVYRGRPLELRDSMYDVSSIGYQDREVIRPLDIPIIHPLAKDSPLPDDGTFTFIRRSFTFMIKILN